MCRGPSDKEKEATYAEQLEKADWIGSTGAHNEGLEHESVEGLGIKVKQLDPTANDTQIIEPEPYSVTKGIENGFNGSLPAYEHCETSYL